MFHNCCSRYYPEHQQLRRANRGRRARNRGPRIMPNDAGTTITLSSNRSTSGGCCEEPFRRARSSVFSDTHRVDSSDDVQDVFSAAVVSDDTSSSDTSGMGNSVDSPTHRCSSYAEFTGSSSTEWIPLIGAFALDH